MISQAELLGKPTVCGNVSYSIVKNGSRKAFRTKLESYISHGLRYTFHSSYFCPTDVPTVHPLCWQHSLQLRDRTYGLIGPSHTRLLLLSILPRCHVGSSPALFCFIAVVLFSSKDPDTFLVIVKYPFNTLNPEYISAVFTTMFNKCFCLGSPKAALSLNAPERLSKDRRQ